MFQGNGNAEVAGMTDYPSRAAHAETVAPLPATERGWAWWLGTVITIAVLMASVWQISQVDFRAVMAMVPVSPMFWLVFALGYLAGPIGDHIIFRRLWQIPIDGFVALLRKLIGNELITGYIGELYFYTWARQRTGMVSAPFGAIKDVAILSAVAANVVTLVLLAIAYPLLGTLKLGLEGSALVASGGIIVAMSSAILLLRKKLFSLPSADLAFVGWVQGLRVVMSLLLTGLAWHLALPDVAVQWWLLLAATRMLLSRLPFLPNKDVVFAALAVFMIGQDAQVGALMAMMASLLLATHLGLGLALVGGEALGWRKK
ncbi:hypothetical protein [Sandarakinorhabdus sp.]|uniref:hypothetical protein n=1 Tax=Sandarakinorhabdus sp. TaxID=1916663 RepID=UPI00286EADA6|nr:hypothetical protein [Sandarakinorhabdus sp.]